MDTTPERQTEIIEDSDPWVKLSKRLDWLFAGVEPDDEPEIKDQPE